jgi:hypothetical protein
MVDKVSAARAEAERCFKLARENNEPKARERYLKTAQSWLLIAEHHAVMSEMNGKSD